MYWRQQPSEWLAVAWRASHHRQSWCEIGGTRSGDRWNWMGEEDAG